MGGSCLLVSRTTRHVRMSAPEIVSMELTVRGRARSSTPYDERLGFVDMAHLSRRFRQAYGISQEWRAQARNRA